MKSDRLNTTIRVTSEEKSAILSAIEAAGVSMGQWVREAIFSRIGLNKKSAVKAMGRPPHKATA